MDDKTVVRFPNDNTVIRPRPGGKRQNLNDSASASRSEDKTKISFKSKQAVVSQKKVNSDSGRIYSQSSRDVMADYRPMSEVRNLSSEHSKLAEGSLAVDGSNTYNDLVHSASTLLSLMIKLSNSVVHNDVPSLKYKLQDEVKIFEINAGRAGISNDKVLQARYVICTTMDEIVASTPWGQESDWSQQSLLSLFHGETWGGEKFYLLLERLLKEPIKNIDILELMYICISLGFQGKYRVIDNGHGEVEHIREDLYRQLRSIRNDFNKELSTNWHGVSDRRGALIRYVPLWVVGALSGVILLAMFSSFTYMLDQSSTPVIKEIMNLGPEVSNTKVEASTKAATDTIEKNKSNSNFNEGNERLVRPPQKGSESTLNYKLLRSKHNKFFGRFV
ncbi:MAG: hypothetical protein GY694_10460 [Gammaproteobacteria bacterium]|nr:hypothetical protein [Gammaproteobacteria bacterium]